MFIRVNRERAHQLRPPLVFKSVDWRAPKGRLTAGGAHAVDDATTHTLSGRETPIAPLIWRISHSRVPRVVPWAGVTRVRIPEGNRQSVETAFDGISELMVA
jgi:hypothetical protein